MLIGEAPGRDDVDRMGLPFVGAAGMLGPDVEIGWDGQAKCLYQQYFAMASAWQPHAFRRRNPDVMAFPPSSYSIKESKNYLLPLGVARRNCC